MDREDVSIRTDPIVDADCNGRVGQFTLIETLSGIEAEIEEAATAAEGEYRQSRGA